MPPPPMVLAQICHYANFSIKVLIETTINYLEYDMLDHFSGAPTLDVRLLLIYRRQNLTSKVDPRTKRDQYL